jgi:hypothetical protein
MISLFGREQGTQVSFWTWHSSDKHAFKEFEFEYSLMGARYFSDIIYVLTELVNC